MPFTSNHQSSGVWDIKLNTYKICGELERMLEKDYTEDITEGSLFWMYVIQIENYLNKCDTMPDFWEWFLDEYNNVEAWNDIQDNFKEDDSEDDSEDDMSDEERKELMGNLKFLIDNGKKAYEILGLPMNTDMDTFMSAMNKYRDEKKYCEVGEHYVEEEDMWPDFADCKNCVSEKDYINTRENV